MSIKVEIVAYTPNPEATVAIAARTCFSDQDYCSIEGQLSEHDVERILATVIAKGHHSVLEHASFTLAISGISRVVSHQLVRHRIASYSQLSQQRSDASELAFVVPPDVRKDPDFAGEYRDLMVRCQEFYKRLVEHGIALGTARYVLPSGFTTRIVMTMNARSLFNLIAQRECAVEEWEFRQLASLIHRHLMTVAPGIFRYAGTGCETHSICPEGEVGLDCGRASKTGAAVENTRDAILMNIGAGDASH